MSRDEDEFGSTEVSRRRFCAGLLAAASLVNGDVLEAQSDRPGKRDIFIVPNFHPASCGWLTTFSKERVYCANSYLNHLDRVRDDPEYKFVISEVNNFIAIMNFRPERIAEFKKYLAEGRIEIVNGYFLESAINLAGGEALLRLGVEGLRWYQQMFGVKPRFSWNIDVCGTHDQMPQIAAELGFEGLVYTRKNATGKSIFESVSPDGTRILTFSPGHYSEAGSLFQSPSPLSAEDLAKVDTFIDTKEPITPAGAPLLILAGSGDYALAPVIKSYPTQLIADWKAARLGREMRFSTFGDYVDAVKSGVAEGSIKIPIFMGGTAYDFDAFWIENPRVKSLFRRNEHGLRAAEILGTLASLEGSFEYPVKPLHDAWVLMCLNMDRNTHWGSAGGMVFVDAQSWDVQDRFDWVEKTTSSVLQASGQNLLKTGENAGLFNPLNWERTDPFRLKLPAGVTPAGAQCEQVTDGSMICLFELPSLGSKGLKLSKSLPKRASSSSSHESIETKYYVLKVDTKTGAVVSLKLRQSGRELFAGPANVIVAERPVKMPKPGDDPGDFMPVRSQRTRLGSSSDAVSTLKVTQGNIATTFDVRGSFYGDGRLRRVIRVYHDHPRIDFETELEDIPNFTVVIAEFPLSDDVSDIRRGIPFGFSHGAWSKSDPNLHGWTKGIVPAVRWSHYALASGGGLALLDRGCSGREIEGRTPTIFLLNAEDKYYGYPNPWLSGKGSHSLEYSLVAHDGDWRAARIPQHAWEYNSPPVLISQTQLNAAQPALQTSDNVIVEAIRREGKFVEIRLVECFGIAGAAILDVHLPHKSAFLADALGNRKADLPSGPSYALTLRPQQIVTIILETDSSVPEPEIVTAWDEFVPKHKLAALHAYDPGTIGLPPKGS